MLYRLEMSGHDYAMTRRLADLYFFHAEYHSEIREAAKLYSNCLSSKDLQTADLSELRYRLATMMAIVNPAAARQHLERFVPSGQGSDELFLEDPLLVKALILRAEVNEESLLGIATKDQTSIRAKVIEDYEMLHRLGEATPYHLQKLASLGRQQANVIREHNRVVASDLERKSERLMDLVVEQQPGNIEVLLRRFQYRMRYAKSRFPDTSDLQRILELEPTNPKALMSLAFFLAQGRSESKLQNSKSALRAAREFLEMTTHQVEDASVVLVALASIHLQLGDLEKSEEVIAVACEDFPGIHVVQVAETRLALMQQQFGRATEAIDRIRAIARKTRSDAWSSPDETMEAMIHQIEADVLEAKLALQSGQGQAGNAAASEILHKIDFSRLRSRERADLLEEIGEIFFQMKDWDYVIDAVEHARDTGIVSFGSDLILAESYDRLGKVDRAADIYQQLTAGRLPGRWGKTIWFRLGMLRLQEASENTGFGAWVDVEQALLRLTAVAPDSEEAFLLNTSLTMARGIADPEAFVSELRAAEENFGNSMRYWLLCTDVYRSLERFRLLQNSIERLAQVSSVSTDELPESVSHPILGSRLTEEDISYVRRISDRWSDSSVDERVEMVRDWCDELSESVAARLTLMNLGSSSNRVELVTEATKLLRDVEAGRGYFWRVSEIAGLTASFRGGEAADGVIAQDRVEALVKEYPGHLVVAQLAANVQETCGDLKSASEHYLRAAKIKPVKWALEGHLRMLVYLRDWEGALQFVQRMPRSAQIDQDAIELVVHVYCNTGLPDAAKELIQHLVNTKNGHTDRTHYLLSLALMREPDRDEAVEAHRHLLDAVDLAPNNLNYWVALFHFETNVYPELWTLDASRTLRRLHWLLQSHSKEYAAEWSTLVLAQTHRIRGRLADSEALYRKALKQNRETLRSGWLPVELMSMDANANAAPITPAVAWLAGDEGSRTLAAFLASWHREPQQGLEIPREDQRLKAIVSVTMNDELAAIASLEKMRAGNRGPGDELLLASLHERLGNASMARDLRIRCARRIRVPTGKLQEILSAALETEDYELGSICFSALEERDLDPVTRHVLESQITIGLGQVTTGLKTWVDAKSDELTDEANRLAFRRQMVDVLFDQRFYNAADELFDDLVKADPRREELRGLWLAGHSRSVDDMMDWLDEQESVDAVTLVEILYRVSAHIGEASPYRDKLVSLANSCLDAETDLFRPQWLMLGAVFERLRLYEIALTACERALPDDGSESMVEHHVIWLSGGYLEALSDPIAELERLVRNFGPREDLMDSKAIFHLLSGQSDAAKAVTAGTTLHAPLNTVYRLHDRIADT
ncbi:MAG: hypothetical protein P8L85_23740 [Rubripirellula sp.]|nr:hypothetical protein [Rubripirellula sp.]